MFRLAFLVLLALAPVTRADADQPIPVVATFSILGDFVRNVGGDRIALQTLVGPNGDAHGYSPKPTDVKKLAAAKLIFVNGLGFERWLDRLIDSAAPGQRLVVASRGVNARSTGGAGDTQDPHAWLSVANARIYVETIRDALSDTDPASKDVYAANAASYLLQLTSLDRDIRDAMGRIPPSRRLAVTPHPSFGYYADAYGLRFLSPGQLNSETEASAKNVAEIINAIRRDKIAAIFVEPAGDPRLARQIASETGIRLGGGLYSDALTSADGAAPSYVAMMRSNLRTIADALRD